MSSIQSVGLVGFGEFGRLLGQLLPSDLEIMAVTRGETEMPDNILTCSMDEVAKCDVVVLCIPLDSYEPVLKQLVPLLPNTTLLVDVCSVKIKPVQLVEQYLPSHHNLLMTHPLFGPQTIQDGLVGKRVIVTQASGERAQEVLDWCTSKGLELVHMTDDAHDREMARVHALTFFIARGLHDMDVKAGRFAPPSFQSLLELVKLDQAHSQALFETMELGNPYAAEVRQELLDSLVQVNKRLSVS